MDGLKSFELLHPSLNVAMKLIIIADKVVDFLEMPYGILLTKSDVPKSCF